MPRLQLAEVLAKVRRLFLCTRSLVLVFMLKCQEQHGVSIFFNPLASSSIMVHTFLLPQNHVVYRWTSNHLEVELASP